MSYMAPSNFRMCAYFFSPRYIGFGYHGDFIMGWPEDLLQEAVDTCTNESGRISDCPVFDIQSEADQNQCKMKIPGALEKEEVKGKVGMSLPGNVAIQYGPEPATVSKPQESQSNTVPVPTVSYSPGAGAAESGNQPGQASPTTPAPAFTAEPNRNQVSVPVPETTEAPSSSVSDDGLPVVSTQYITNGNVVSEIIWKEDVVYVTQYKDTTTTTTMSPAATVKVRDAEHLHRHAARHGRRH